MPMNKDKGTVDFHAQDPEYAAKIAAIKAGKNPVGGAPMPPVPRFDQAPPDRYAGVQGARSSHAVLTPQQREELTQQGRMIPGVGAAYVVNQPAVQAQSAPAASKETGEYINPPRPEGSGLRPETVQQLEAVAQANKKAVEPATNEDDFLDELDQDGWETDEFGNRVRSLLNNKKRKDEIEKRLEPLRLEDLITINEVRQKVPILPGRLEPTYRSTGGNEDLFIKKILSNERGSNQYMLDMFSLMNLVIGLHSLNGREFPTHLKDGEPDEALFRAKLKIVARMPMALLADLSVNYVWFNKRVQKLFVADNVKGF